MPRRPLADDPNLLISFREGKEEAFDLIFREYFPVLTHFATGLTGDESAAKDIVQECFTSLWKRRNSLPTIGSISDYLYTSIRYSCFKHYRQKSKDSKVKDEIGHLQDFPEETIFEEITKAEVYRELLHSVEQLPPQMQAVVRFYYLEGKNYQEIGDLLGNTPGTVRQQRISALKFLRKIFSTD